MTDTTETGQVLSAEAPETNQAETAASNPATSNQSPAQSADAATAPGVEPSPESALADDPLIAARALAEWRVIGETVPGASHLRAAIPNQDALRLVRQSSVRLPVIVSLSDGHGSNKCFRSDRGSRFAVRIGCDLLDELINGRHAALSPTELECRVRESLPAEFIKRWRAAVERDLKREPFREEEFARMVEKDGEGARGLVEANPHLAYGATSLSFLLTPAYALYLQLGDGEMVTVSAEGRIGLPLSGDARLLANETTSLCLEGAADDFRFAIHPHGADDLPALILMTTDGYYNSFSTTAGFHQVGSDLVQMLREENGFDTVSRGLKGWLEEATAAGSGDDCTLAIICRMDALKPTVTLNDAASASESSTVSPADSSSSVSSSQNPTPQVSGTPDAPPAPAASHE